MRKNRLYLEYKFLVTPSQKLLFLKELKNCLKPDSYGDNGRYELDTIYYDTKQLDSYFDKLEGEYYKAKLRYRKYSSGDELLELKLKEGDRTKKLQLSEFKVGSEGYPGIMLGAELCQQFSFKIPSPLEFFRKVFYPVCRIYYDREAYFFEELASCRITFDSCIEACPILAPSPAFEILPKQQILEIKTPTPLPGFLLSLLKRHSIVQANISKYALCLEQSVLNNNISGLPKNIVLN